MRTPIFVLGLFDTGLYVAQSVAKYRIPIYGFDHNQKNPGFYSRHIKSFLSAHPYLEPEKLLLHILNISRELSSKPVLIPASEDYVGFINKYRSELEKQFTFQIPDTEVLDNIVNKEGQFKIAKECNLLVPEYYCINSETELQGFLNHYNNQKVIVKALDQQAWKAKITRKAYILEDPLEISKIGNSLLQQDIRFIIQTLIKGDCTNNFEFNALMLNGEIIESCVIQKIRQYPPGYGAACCIQTVQNPAIEEYGRRFLIHNKIEGFSNTEFKLNPDDNQFYFIETNARVWQQIRLTEYNKQNFIYKYYQFLTSEKKDIPNSVKFNQSIKWVDVFSDSLLWWRYLRKTDLGFLSYFISLKNTKNFGLLNLNDIRPFLHEIREMNFFNRKRNK